MDDIEWDGKDIDIEIKPTKEFKTKIISTSVSVAGNNGGDIFDISQSEFEDENVVMLKVGSSCVISVDGIVPIEFLTKAVEHVLLEFGTIEIFIDSIGWNKEYKDKLKSQIKRYSKGY